MNHFPQASEYAIRAVKKFFQKFAAQGGMENGKWKNSLIIKVLIILFGHLWEVELTYRYFFASKFTLRSQQPDIVPIIFHRCH
jgi:hypothetical protein